MKLLWNTFSVNSLVLHHAHWLCDLWQYADSIWPINLQRLYWHHHCPVSISLAESVKSTLFVCLKDCNVKISWFTVNSLILWVLYRKWLKRNLQMWSTRWYIFSFYKSPLSDLKTTIKMLYIFFIFFFALKNLNNVCTTSVGKDRYCLLMRQKAAQSRLSIFIVI